MDVSISLSGNEAHITFRSDQSQTRDLLDSSVAQLREMLLNQGLELSGMTVSSAGTQGDPSSDTGGRRGGQQGTRQGEVKVTSVTGANPRASIVTDRTVDIFV